MKVAFNKADLLTAISEGMGCVSGKNVIQAAEGFKFETEGDDYCVITSFDLDKGFKKRIPCKVSNPGCYVIPASRLSQIVSIMPEGDILIEVDSKGNTKISGGKTEFGLMSQPGADFPTLPDIGGERGFTIKQSILKNMIDGTRFAVSVNDVRPVLNGCFFEIKGNKITAVGCDGNRIAVREEICDIENKNEDGSELDLSFVVPSKTVGEIIRHTNEEDTVSIKLTRRYAFFFFEDFCLFSRLIDSEYIDYRKFIRGDSVIFVTADKESLTEGLKRASIITEDKTMGQTKSAVKCRFEENLLTISSASVSSKVSDEMPIKKKGDDIEINFNCRYILDAVEHCDGDEIKLSLSTPSSGVLVEPAEPKKESKYLYLVLPVRVR